MFETILIANRGEIACRVIRTCRRMGIRAIAVYSEADANAQHVRLADAAYPIGGSRPADSYLRGDLIIDTAKKSGAQAIHPGYGFLSENADFADAAEQAGLVFIGPRAASMRKMGSKAGAKELMAARGVPVVPGYTGEDQNPALLTQEALRVGFPLMIKAAHGGGGKGMRIVRSADEFVAALESCQRESKNAFGRDRVLLERYIEQPRHIEFQVFGDSHGHVIHLNERECSAQRRYQKVLEETPSPFLNSERRERMGDAAVEAARAIDYVNAGTVEFIVAPNGEFFFMEINTRLQVEHPVTEMVTGLDLVEWQLRVAAGEPLPRRQTAMETHGHAIELRLYAEDPERGFLPGSGRLNRLSLPPQSAHLRIDSGVIEGDTVSIFYDPMIAKMIAWDLDRPRALARMRDALALTDIEGPKSNVDFLEALIRHPKVIDGSIDTSYLDHHLDDVLTSSERVDETALYAATVACLLLDERDVVQRAQHGSDPHSPWARSDAWRLGHPGKRLECFSFRGERIEVAAHGSAGDYRLDLPGHALHVSGARLFGSELSARFDGQSRRFTARVDAHSVSVHDGTRRHRFERIAAYAFEAGSKAGGNRVLAPMPGRIVAVKSMVGAAVVEGQELLVMEAMKMEITLRAACAGIVAELRAVVGDFVEADAILVLLGDKA